MKSALLVIAPTLFRDEEYAEPKQIFETNGIVVTTASISPGDCIGKLGMHATAELSLGDALGGAWDTVVFVGGAGAQVFFDDATAHALARETLDRRALLAAICIAPSTLAHAGLLDGVRATAFPSQREDLVASGALWEDGPVVVDGCVVTANGPEAARDFAETIVALLEGPIEGERGALS
ncbi:MAG: DJ-1 family protein [Actinobacteria bacterium HGW-Actinobacteria-7]|nr:MAG: DJ-1 family protein [Actinobacteria bacterium HGW-Actinobacteria-7]